MGWLSNIFRAVAPSVLGNIFSGGSSILPQSGIQTNVPGLVNTPQLLANAAASFHLPGGSDWLGGIGNAVSNAVSNNGGGNLLSGVDVGAPMDTSGWSAPPTPVDPINYQPQQGIFNNIPGLNVPQWDVTGGSGIDWAHLLPPPATQGPLNVQPGAAPQTNVPGLVNTPDILNTAGQIINGQQPTTGNDTPAGGKTPPFDLSKWLTTLAGAGGLAALLGGQQNDLGPDADKLRAMAGDISGQRGRLMDTSLANQQGLINDQAINAIERRLRASEAGMRGKYAQMGMSGSTMEQQDLASLREKAQDEIFATGQEMATTGLQTAAQMTGQESTIYQVLMNAQIQKDQELGRVLAEFAAASAR